MVFGTPSQDEKAVALAIGVSPWFVKDYLLAARLYSYSGVEKLLLLLHQYNLRSVGIKDTGTGDAALLREMLIKIMT